LTFLRRAYIYSTLTVGTLLEVRFVQVVYHKQIVFLFIHTWKPISKKPTGRPKTRWEDDVNKDRRRRRRRRREEEEEEEEEGIFV
jgi:hypothetical protein